MWVMHDGWGWWMVFSGFWALLFWIAIIWLVIWGIKSLAGHHGSKIITSGKPSPLDIAKERYAKGEISKDEFDQIRKDLT